MARKIYGYVRTLVLASSLSALAFAAPPMAFAATTPPPLSPSVHPCVSAAGVLSADASCHAALDAARAKWPEARVALDGAGAGNGSYIIPSPDGAHFDEVTNIVSVSAQPAHAAGTPGRTAGFRPVQDVYALVVVYSNSGTLGAAYPCGTILDWSSVVYYNTFYGAHLEMDSNGYVDKCYYAVTSNMTPVVWGAGSWYQTHGAGGNKTWTTNPWMDWYGSFWGCCSDTVLLRFYTNGNGAWSSAVWN